MSHYLDGINAVCLELHAAGYTLTDKGRTTMVTSTKAPAHDRWLAAQKARDVAQRYALKYRRLGGSDDAEANFTAAQQEVDRIRCDPFERAARGVEREAVLQRIDATRAEAVAALEALASAPPVTSADDTGAENIAHEGPIVERACAALDAYEAACLFATSTPSVTHDGWSAHREHPLENRATMLRQPGRLHQIAAPRLKAMAAELHARTTIRHDCCLYDNVAEASKAVERA